MDTPEEPRATVAAILKAQSRLRAERAWQLDQFLATVTAVPQIAFGLRGQLDRLHVLYTQEREKTTYLDSAITEGRPFAGLLQAYVAQPGGSLADSIQ
jgi:hypothetical protein